MLAGADLRRGRSSQGKIVEVEDRRRGRSSPKLPEENVDLRRCIKRGSFQSCNRSISRRVSSSQLLSL